MTTSLRMRGAVVSWAVLGMVVAAMAKPLPSDDRIKTGKLENGVTWMYRQHDNPPGKMALMVNIDSGSLNETDAQRGLAHFMEHMCFNGTEHYPPGTLIKYFESIGMEFGADLNAFTSFDQTAYMLFLPDTTEQDIDKGLMTLSDYVFRASLLKEEIDKERGVIMAEWRTGKSAQQRVRDKEIEEVFAGSRFAKRIPIGTEEVIQGAPKSEFDAYYRTWYRPELTTVMMVGDAPIERVLPSVKKWFGEYKAPVPAKEQKGPEFKMFDQMRAFVYTDPELAACTVKMRNLEPGRKPVTTVEEYRRDLVESVGAWIVNRRFDERVQQGDAAYQYAYVYAADYFNDAVMVEGVARGEPKDWNTMLDQLVGEAQRAKQHGLTKRELELARKEILADAERAVETEPTRNARGILMSMNSSVADQTPIMSAEQELALIKELLPTVTLDEVNQAYSKHLEPDTFAFIVTMPEGEEIKVPAKSEVLSAAKKAMSQKTEAMAESDAPTKILEKMPEAGEVVDSSFDEDLGIASAWLSNNVRVHHRFMDYKKDNVMVSIALAGGRIEETEATQGLTQAATSALRSQPATSRLTSTNVRDLMTGLKVSVSSGAGPDTMLLRISGSPEDLEAGFQLAHALLTDGKIEDSAVKVWKQSLKQRLKMLESVPDFRAYEALVESVYDNDPRMQPLLPESRIDAIETPAIQTWFDQIRRQASIEVAVVGEIDRDKAMELVAKYVGSLNKRERKASRLDSLRTLEHGKGPWSRSVEVETQTPRAMAIVGFLGCDESDVHDTRALELASHILSSQLVEEIREKQGLVYSLQARNSPATAYRDAGIFFTQAPCEVGKASKVVDEVHKVFSAFRDSGPTDDELSNAVKQIENNLDEDMREPSYWLSVLSDLTYHGRNLQDEKEEASAYRKISTDEVKKVFGKYYTAERKFDVAASPKPAAEESDNAKEETPES
jgi:zinc protease